MSTPIECTDGNCSVQLVLCGECYGASADPRQFGASPYDFYNLFVIGILLPTIGLFGLVGDSLSAFIYSRACMISSVNTYLCALALSDLVVISTAYFLFFLENVRKYSLTLSKFYARTVPLVYPMGMMAQTISVFLTVAAAFDCYMMVAQESTRWCRVRVARRVIFAICIIASLYNITHFFEIYQIECYSRAFNAPSLDVCPTDIRSNEIYVNVYHVWLYTIVMAAGPVVLLILLNTAIILAIAKQKRRRQQSGNGETSSSSSDSTTLILVVFLFIFCNALVGLAFIFGLIASNNHFQPLTANVLETAFDDSELVQSAMSYLIDMSNLLVVCNSSANFLIYYTFGESFRSTLKNYFKSRQQLHYSTILGFSQTDEQQVNQETMMMRNGNNHRAADTKVSTNGQQQHRLATTTTTTIVRPTDCCVQPRDESTIRIVADLAQKPQKTTVSLTLSNKSTIPTMLPVKEMLI